MQTPYNTGKVKIGLLYNKPQKNYMDDRDMVLLQSVLLNQPNQFGQKMKWIFYCFVLFIATIVLLKSGL
jgi:hypothetical protein